LNGRHFFPERAWRVLLRLGGKLGLRSERDGPYLLLKREATRGNVRSHLVSELLLSSSRGICSSIRRVTSRWSYLVSYCCFPI
jgi:hypothetical protein